MEHSFNLFRHKYAEPFLFFISITILVAACISKADSLNDANAKPKLETAVVGTPVDGVVVQPGTVREELEVTGTLIANQQVDIVSELTRRIIKVHVKEGSKVRAGTLLFQLDDADLQAQLQRLRQQEKLALLNEQRLKDLLAHEAIAQQDYDEAITNLKVLEAQIVEIQVTISKTRIVAPFNGQVGIIKVYPGSVVSVNNVLTDIEDNSVIKVEFSVPEKYANIIVPGSTHSFTIASDKKQYSATVAARAASLTENTRTLLMHALASNPDGHLLPGQSARLNLGLSTSGEALSVSSQALIPSSKGYTVYVSRSGVVEATPVEIGQRSAGSVEITQGLHKGDTVITSNLLRLVPGAAIQFVTLKN
ncbi:MAG TPA: efflux RND transporter periplasmic adaptor subunit [Chryseolinea sp.]|nr:efflux RND transporter periplasmic adaptor subunit [Chryseolinea sp.]